MNRKKIFPILIASTFVLAAVFALTAYGPVSAAVNSLTNTTGPGSAHAGMGRGPGGGYTNEDLASALGIPVDELSAAYLEASEAALDQAVTAGLITQSQADSLRERGLAFPFGNRWNSWLSEQGIDFNALLAEALGVTEVQLQEAYTEAAVIRIDRLVEEGRITEEQADLLKGQQALFSSDSFQSAMQSAFEAAVQQAVGDGLITQAQADRILENSLNFGGFKGFGGHGMHGGKRAEMGGGFFGERIPSQPSVTPSGGL